MILGIFKADGHNRVLGSPWAHFLERYSLIVSLADPENLKIRFRLRYKIRL